MQQRIRAAFDAVRRDVALAGAGGSVRRDAGSLTFVAPPVLPLRLGLRGADPPGTFRPDAITVLAAAPMPAAATTLGQPMPAFGGAARVNIEAGCPAADPVCALAVDVDVLVADREGAFDLFTVTDVIPPILVLRHNTADWPKVYPAGSTIAPVVGRTYYLRAGSAARPPQLVRYDGGSGPDVPVIDHVVGLAFEYFGEPAPPRMLRPLSDGSGPWTTYGPKPPPADTTVAPYTAGSNCLFEANGSAIATPRLPALGGVNEALVPLPPGRLTDGPWCPDDAAPGRYDADLLRVRSVVISVRVESALDALRGPAGLLFSRSGTARAGDRYAPDLEIRMRVTPPNLAAGR